LLTLFEINGNIVTFRGPKNRQVDTSELPQLANWQRKLKSWKKTPQGWFAMQPSLVRRYGRFASIIPNGLTLIVQNPKWPRCSIWIYQRGGITRVDGKQDVESTFLVIVCWICSQRGYAMYTRFIISCINYKLYNNLQWIYMVTPPPGPGWASNIFY